MLWFDGSVRNAIDKVKTSEATLIVFVKGENEVSMEFESFLNKETTLQHPNYVAIKISHSSLAFQQFKQIYVTVPIPSLFFIKNGGIPTNVVSLKNTSDIREALNDALAKESNSFQCKNNFKQHISQGKEDQVERSNKKCDKKSSSKSSYAKNIGYKLIDISEDEIKKRLIEIRGFPRFLLIDNSSPEPVSFSHPIARIHSARIQFRLPNNEMPSWEFPDLSTLGDIRAYLMEKMKLSSSFKLMRAYSRTGFTAEDENKTLIDLSLTPTSTLIVIPVHDKTVQAKFKSVVTQQNIVSLVVHTFLQPFLILINYFKKHVLKIEDGNRNERPTRLPSEPSIGKILNKKTSTSNIQGFNFDDEINADSGSE